MESPAKPKRSRWTFILVCVFLAILGAAIIIPNYIKAHSHPCQNACINNLRQIDGAKEQWALANHKKDGEPVSKEDEVAIDQFIKGGHPLCPSGDPSAQYSYNAVGAAPSCSFKRGSEVHTLATR